MHTGILQRIWAVRELDAHAKLVLIYLTDLQLYQPWVHVRDAARALGLRPSRVLAILYSLHGKGFIRLGIGDSDQRQWFSINWDRLGVWIGGWHCGGGAVQ